MPSAVALLRDQFGAASQFLEATMMGVTPEQAHWVPPGTAHPIGERYAHVAQSADAVVNGVLKGGAPLAATSWAGKTGTSEPVMRITLEIAQRVKVDLPAARQYGQAVYAAVSEYIASLKDEDLNRPIDLSFINSGQQSVAWVLTRLVINHFQIITGEIAVIKGVQGLKGSPV